MSNFNKKQSPSVLTVGRAKYTKVQNPQDLSGYVSNQINSFFDATKTPEDISPSKKRKPRRMGTSQKTLRGKDNSLLRKASLINPKKLVDDQELAELNKLYGLLNKEC